MGLLLFFGEMGAVMRLFCGFLCCFWVFLTGCGGYYVSVDSINDGRPIAAGTTFFVFSGTEEVGQGDLRFSEFAGCVRRALESRGYVAAQGVEDAEVVVLLSYGMGQEEERIYGYGGDLGYRAGGVWNTYGTVENRRRGNSTYCETTEYWPAYDGWGVGAYAETYLEYTFFAHLTACEGRFFREGKEVMLWETNITSTSASDDMRRMFPVMMGAARAYLGEDTGRQREVVVGENDEAVKLVGGGGISGGNP